MVGISFRTATTRHMSMWDFLLPLSGVFWITSKGVCARPGCWRVQWCSDVFNNEPICQTKHHVWVCAFLISFLSAWDFWSCAGTIAVGDATYLGCSPPWHFSRYIAIEILTLHLNLRSVEYQLKLSSPMLQWQRSSFYSLRSLRLSQRQTAFLVNASRNGPMKAHFWCEALQSVKQSTGKGFQSWLCRLLQSIVRFRTASSSATIPLEFEPNDSHLVLPLRIFTSATFLREDWVCGDLGLRSQVSFQQTNRETLQALSVHVGLSPLKDNTHSSRESA